MYGRVKQSYRRQLTTKVNDLEHVRVLAHVVSGSLNNSNYVIESNWKGCGNPAHRPEETLLYLDSSINPDESTISGAYWITTDAIEILSDYKSNKSAVGLLSKE